MPLFLPFYYLCHINPQMIMELLRYYYHADHIGSSSWITDGNGQAIQHLHYLPFGEDWVDQRNSSWNAPYTFSGKEKDAETGYGYFGARYYDSGLSIWLSVDPMSDKYPSMSPYNYCANNPVILVDPDGRDIINVSENGKISIQEQDGNDQIVFEKTGHIEYLEGNGLFRNKKTETEVTDGDKVITQTKITGFSKEDTGKFYDLFRNNTSVEWGILSYTKTDGSSFSSFGTSHNSGSEGSISQDALKAPQTATNLRYDHSHSANGRASDQNFRPSAAGSNGGKVGDIEYWNDLLKKHPTATCGIHWGKNYLMYIKKGDQTETYKTNKPIYIK